MTLLELIIIAIALLVAFLGHTPVLLSVLVATVAIIVIRIIRGDRSL